MSFQVMKSDVSSPAKEQRKHGRKKDLRTLKRVALLFRPYRNQMVFVLLAIIVTSALNLVVPLLIPPMIDDALAHRNMSLLFLYGTAQIAAACLSGVIGVGQTYLNNLVGQHVMRDLRNKLYAHLHDLSFGFFTSTRTGEIQSRLSNDVASAQSAVTDTFTNAMTTIVTVFGTIAAMFYLSPSLTLVSFILLPLFLFFTFRVGNVRRKSVKATQQSLASLNALMQETLSISGMLLIKTFGRKKFAQHQFEAENQKLTELSIRQQMLGRWFFMGMNVFMTLMPVSLCIVAGLLLIYVPRSIHITVGILFAFLTIQGRFFGPFNQLLVLLVEAQGSLALFDRLFEYLDQKVEIEDAPNALHLSPLEVQGKVTFEDVCFTYKKHDFCLLSETRESGSPLEGSAFHATLENLSFTAKPGQLVALVGPSGAGKTTITYMISRLYDVDRGMIAIDGHDVRKIAMTSLEDVIGVVTQETYLFHASIRDNLLYVRPEAREEELVTAAQAAAIHDRILQLDEGYDTIVGERGYKLSGGEKQRLAIARVLLKDPKILILDEATSSLDTGSERLVQKALEPLMKGRTTIAIAHRLSTILAADLILVLDKGQIVERGTHQELLRQEGLYAKLYHQQFARQVQEETIV